jgi:hypothetical protein
MTVFLLLAISIQPVSAQQTSGSTPPPSAQDAVQKIFLPIVANPPESIVADLEITQSIQNLSVPVHLIAGRQTLVRVYARTSQSSPVTGLSARLQAYRGSVYLGEIGPLSGSAYPYSVSTSSMRADKSKTFNFLLPANWVNSAGSLTFNVLLTNSTLAPDTAAQPSTYTQASSFISVPAVNVVAVPIRVDGIYGPADTAYIQDAIYRMFPVPAANVSVHSVYNYYADMTYTGSWYQLLDEISALHDSEVGFNSDTVYYGVVPLRDANGYSWFTSSGIAGIGWVGDRISVGVSNETFKIPGSSYLYTLHGDDTASHEIGHNFDRLHTEGCGASNSDENYPYSYGLIGQYGYRFSSQSVIPNTYNDIMNYCDNQWISDYTYNGLLQDQLATLTAISSPAQDSLYVRAQIAQDGSVSIQPVYAFTASPDNQTKESEYRLQFLNDTGEVVAEHPARVVIAQEKNASIRAIRTSLPRPEKPFSKLRLLHNGLEVASRSFAKAGLAPLAAPSAAQQNGSLLLKWSSSEKPAMVRYSRDGGQSWTTIGVDVSAGEFRYALSDLPSGNLRFQILLSDSAEILTLDWDG